MTSAESVASAKAAASGAVWINAGRENGREAAVEYKEVKTMWLGLDDGFDDPFNPVEAVTR